MSFLTWIKLSIFIDISFLVFAVALIWKNRKLKKEIDELEDKLLFVVRNPSRARKTLNLLKNKVK